MTTMEAVLEVMKVLLQRPDAPLFTPEELADKAFQYADAAAKRVQQYNDVVAKDRMANIAQKAVSIDHSLDAMKYAILQGRNRT